MISISSAGLGGTCFEILTANAILIEIESLTGRVIACVCSLAWILISSRLGFLTASGRSSRHSAHPHLYPGQEEIC